MPDRIFVVGHGTVTCLGPDMRSTWQGLVAGRSGVRRHAELRSEAYLQDLGGMVEGFGPGTDSEDPTIAKLSARFLHLAMAAAREAYVDSGMDQKEGLIDPHRVAVVVGSAFGGLDLLDAEQERMSHRRSLAASPYLIPGMIVNQAAGQIAQHLRSVWTERGAGERVCLGRARGRCGRDVSPIGRGRRGRLRRRR